MNTSETSNNIASHIKENVLVYFSISIVVSYFACYGYYLNFNIDISTFLSIEDLTIIYAKWIWLSIISTFICFSFMYLLFKSIGNKDTWWDKTIGKTMYKRRILYVIPMLVIIVFLAIKYKEVSKVLSYIAGLSVVLVLLFGGLTMLYSSLTSKKDFTNSSVGDWLNLTVAAYMFVFFLPIFGGIIAAQNNKADSVQVIFEDGKILNSKDSTNYLYIGKTTNYFFISDTLTDKTTAFSMDKVKSITVIQAK